MEEIEIIELPDGLLSEQVEQYEKVTGAVYNQELGQLSFDTNYGKGTIYEIYLQRELSVVISSIEVKKKLKIVRTNTEKIDQVKFNVFLKGNEEGLYDFNGVKMPAGVVFWSGGKHVYGDLQKGKFQWLTFYLSKSIVNNMEKTQSLEKWLHFIDENEFILIFESLTIELEDLSQRVLSLLGRKEAWADMMLKGLALQMMSLNIQMFYKRIINEKNFQVINSDDLQALFRIKQMIHESTETPPVVSDLAERANMSLRKFQRLFKQTFGVGASEYFQKVRMEKSVEMMRAGTYSLMDISTTLGFSSTSHFSSSFKKYFKQTPRKYMSSLKQYDH
ncbi:helix-turn-helix transcriptional regulator [Sediminitomix flava]|uniref:AraC-like DNA-binding protein n=1 Tax=Sediminitomix flava TaxID=379075 RepID=A0A316A484_SEDFL|nr:AraC family transcriptional regulator [Sediminitomix flava]PWJ44547.1 AraC-like DNA-binding protein [Sediminitomix flava]